MPWGVIELLRRTQVAMYLLLELSDMYIFKSVGKRKSIGADWIIDTSIDWYAISEKSKWLLLLVKNLKYNNFFLFSIYEEKHIPH